MIDFFQITFVTITNVCDQLIYFNLCLFVIGLFQLTFVSELGKYDIEVTTFQMAVLFAWNERRNDKLSFHDLR